MGGLFARPGLGGEVLVRAAAALILHVGAAGATPSGAAKLDRFVVCGLRCWGGFDQAEFRIGCFGHRWILPVDSVRGSGQFSVMGRLSAATKIGVGK
jgi:hypothetical protein